MNFAESLKNIRKEQKLSQQELAGRLSVAQSTVGMWESGKRTPKLDELDRLAGVLNITMTRLIGQKQEVEIGRSTIVIGGRKIDINELDRADIEGIVEYIDYIKSKKGVQPKRPPAHAAQGAKKVLIIDDEQEVCKTLYSFLVPHNYKVFFALNAQMGLEYFDEIKPDIVLLDLKLPDTDGVETLKVIRKISEVPVIVITRHPEDVSDIHASGLKIEGYIEKPISLKAVLNTLKHTIGE